MTDENEIDEGEVCIYVDLKSPQHKVVLHYESPCFSMTFRYEPAIAAQLAYELQLYAQKEEPYLLGGIDQDGRQAVMEVGPDKLLDVARHLLNSVSIVREFEC